MDSTVTIDQTTKSTPQSADKGAAITALATVGFIALLIIGITLAIYSARYIPIAISKLGNGTATSNTPNSLAVVPSNTTNSQNIAFGNDGSDLLTATTTTTVTPPTAPVTAAVVTAPAVTPTYSAPVSTAPKHVAPYGLPDLSVTIVATGYLAGDSTDTFTPASIIPPGARPAVKFSIANDGTNVTGSWSFLAQIPTANDSVFNSPIEPSLNPGDHTVFTLGFNEAIPGPAQTITIVADPQNNVAESNEGNNSAAAVVTITQTGN